MDTWELHITGRVQGVGFRPHVYRLARRLKLRGEVRNGPDGVRVVLSASRASADQFRQQLLDQPPGLARIATHHLRKIKDQTFSGFTIVHSLTERRPTLNLSPDFAMCEDCAREFTEPTDRRFAYPFITCTNCGPRYAITTALPYDRERTTMAGFTMCTDCAREYQDHDDRRYFSQTNSCPYCGVILLEQQENGARTQVQGWGQAVRQLRAGGIVAVKGVAGYLLLARADDPTVIARLRERKQRPDKPLALLYPDIATVESGFNPAKRCVAELQSSAAPIVLLHTTDRVRNELCTDALAPGLDRLGVMLPNNPLLAAIAADYGAPLVATSANLSGEPILSEGQTTQAAKLADYVLSHNLPIAQAQDDSLITLTKTTQQLIILRRGRGLAPALLHPAAQGTGEDALACGADLKGSLGLRAGGTLHVSPYLGDLANYRTQLRFTTTLKHLKNTVQAQPAHVITDLHPNYFSSALGQETAKDWNASLHTVQHHEAHFAAVLGENNLLESQKPILGVIWDGTGYGSDGHIWGGEFFRFEDGQISRLQHYPYFPHLGGNKMAQDLRYAALAWVGADERARPRLTDALGTATYHNLLHLRQRHHLRTSSIGRLFDGVAFLLGLGNAQAYEGHAALLLQQLAGQGLSRQPDLMGYNPNRLRDQLLEDIHNSPPEIVAARFHLTLVNYIKLTAAQAGINHLAFSGGVFQNTLLVDLITQRMPEYQLHFHQQLSPNDENIAYGQLIHFSLKQGREIHHKQPDHVLSYSR